MQRLFSMMPSAWKRCSVCLNSGDFHWTSRTSMLCVTEHWHRLCRQVVESPPWRSSKATWCGPGQSVFSGSAWARWLDKMTSRGPFQPQLLCDSYPRDVGALIFSSITMSTVHVLSFFSWAHPKFLCCLNWPPGTPWFSSHGNRPSGVLRRFSLMKIPSHYSLCYSG